TDGVTRDDELRVGQQATLCQFLVCEQGGRNDQGLSDRGVGDLFGRRGGTQPNQVEAAGLRPDVELVRGAGKIEPRGEHPLGLRTLSGRKQCNHVFKRTLWKRFWRV